jgi:type I site-specific restriction endonuclease
MTIDGQLAEAGWMVQSHDQMNLGAGLGVVVREFATASGPVDYALFVGRTLCGVVEAKPEGPTLSGFSDQAAPSLHTMGFFGSNLVAQYPYERSVADGVNVPYEIYRIRTDIGEHGGAIPKGYQVPVRDKRTRAECYEELDQDLAYTAQDLDRSVVVPNQIRTVLEAYRDSLFTELFPGRSEVPKTLIFCTTTMRRRSSASSARSSAAATTSRRRSPTRPTAPIPTS